MLEKRWWWWWLASMSMSMSMTAAVMAMGGARFSTVSGIWWKYCEFSISRKYPIRIQSQWKAIPIKTNSTRKITKINKNLTNESFISSTKNFTAQWIFTHTILEYCAFIKGSFPHLTWTYCFYLLHLFASFSLLFSPSLLLVFPVRSSTYLLIVIKSISAIHNRPFFGKYNKFWSKHMNFIEHCEQISDIIYLYCIEFITK